MRANDCYAYMLNVSTDTLKLLLNSALLPPSQCAGRRTSLMLCLYLLCIPFSFQWQSDDMRNHDAVLTRERFDELFFEYWTSHDDNCKVRDKSVGIINYYILAGNSHRKYQPINSATVYIKWLLLLSGSVHCRSLRLHPLWWAGTTQPSQKAMTRNWTKCEYGASLLPSGKLLSIPSKVK